MPVFKPVRQKYVSLKSFNYDKQKNNKKKKLEALTRPRNNYNEIVEAGESTGNKWSDVFMCNMLSM